MLTGQMRPVEQEDRGASTLVAQSPARVSVQADSVVQGELPLQTFSAARVNPTPSPPVVAVSANVIDNALHRHDRLQRRGSGLHPQCRGEVRRQSEVSPIAGSCGV